MKFVREKSGYTVFEDFVLHDGRVDLRRARAYKTIDKLDRADERVAWRERREETG